ncbi:hypothetical protein NBRC10513_006315 [Rhodotorula toruloides]|uniref:Proteophosphoglycan ppg4 n=1 Tax=Rhodotorula toruloides TaxID=5286 RepID=A0A2T0A2Y5_RHOTO|nr:Proteophosphoglycan ppg4 [Rhodotorula toruloides]
MTSLTARRCVVCDAEATKRCSSCAKAGIDLFFCSSEHFQQVWLGHSILCGKSPPFCRYSAIGEHVDLFKECLNLPLEKTLRLQLLQLASPPQDDRPSLARLRFRKTVERILGFDPWKPGTKVDDTSTVAAELQRLTGTSAETLLRHLGSLSPDYIDLVPFHDVLVAGLGSLYDVPTGPRTRDVAWGDKGQLYSLLLFEAAQQWLSHRQEAGEPPVDPGLEAWWTQLIHRLSVALYSSPVNKSYRYAFDCHEQCFATTFACLKRGTDYDDPDLSKCFSTGLYAFDIIAQLLRPSEPSEADAALLAPAPPKKVKRGQVKMVRLRVKS